MRKCMVVCAVCAVVALLASVAMAGNGLPSASKMDQMGLSSATVVSDDAAMGVRGMGFTSVKAWGSSRVHVLATGTIDSVGVGVIELESINGHEICGQTVAFGGNLSIVGGVVGQAQGNGTTQWQIAGAALFAGGLSGGFAQ